MATMTRPRDADPDLMTSRMFAQVFQAYMECSEELQEVIRDMASIVNDPEATNEEQAMACSTIAEALFPWRCNGLLGVNLEEEERVVSVHHEEAKKVYLAMDKQEAHFGARVQELMAERDQPGRTGPGLRNRTAGGLQPPVARQSPPRRTVEKIATALGVPPTEIWPEFGDAQ